MQLRFRPARLEDIDECVDCLADGFAYEPRDLGKLVHIWREIIETGCGNFSIIEDENLPRGQRLVRFSVRVFVTDDYLHRMSTDLPPTVGRTLVDRRADVPSPMLSLAEMRRANTHGGLNMIPLSYGLPERHLIPKSRAEVATRTVDWIRYSSGGYRLRTLIVEVYDEFDYRWAEGLGCVLLTDYHSVDSPDFIVNSEYRPRLYGIRAGVDPTPPGTMAYVLFNAEQPRFGLTASQQEMLLHAMQGATDEELADELRLAPVTVKKRWSAIYDRVSRTAPDVLSIVPEQSERGAKGLQRRRRLIEHLRGHMEELRPYEPRK